MLVDSHCHLDFPEFEPQRDEVIARAKAAGVGHMVTISTRIRKFPSAVLPIAERYPEVTCSIGTHPHYASEERGIPLPDIVAYTRHPRVVAIGESGLDYFYDKSAREDQQTVFRKHIAAARQTGLPLVIHTRDAEEDTAAILTEEMVKGPFKALLHCYTSGRALAEAALELGLFISFSGILTFPKSDELRELAASVPLDRLLVETDSPYLAPPPYRGKTNEPSFVRFTAKVLAETKGVSEAELERATTENFFRLFAKAKVAAAQVGDGAT
ncbi:LuxR family transcriptional regulator [Rhodomicrobium udaipurense JA643]|uniref:TatD family hydrolase n=1 Tax=Rhodomicrobium udaipurense TaxID=1202716 RepID=A0A8I1KIW9_9HYPH|nr:TatD family hydrolase [Rhodomicrobium udaipurense]KAI94515.1 LuxR family transcriptional regulator [Rhodomicrobium udaipurense JA643]MBJ7542201.1 TatD family hydrolase [Rhodomicrobium udaipurense]